MVSPVELLAFLRSIKTSGVATWQRLQAARSVAALDAAASHLHRDGPAAIVVVLADRAAAGRRGDAGAAKREQHFPVDEPEPVLRLRRSLRRRRYKLDTETAYVKRLAKARSPGAFAPAGQVLVRLCRRGPVRIPKTPKNNDHR